MKIFILFFLNAEYCTYIKCMYIRTYTSCRVLPVRTTGIRTWVNKGHCHGIRLTSDHVAIEEIKQRRLTGWGGCGCRSSWGGDQPSCTGRRFPQRWVRPLHPHPLLKMEMIMCCYRKCLILRIFFEIVSELFVCWKKLISSAVAHGFGCLSTFNDITLFYCHWSSMQAAWYAILTILSDSGGFFRISSFFVARKFIHSAYSNLWGR